MPNFIVKLKFYGGETILFVPDAKDGSEAIARVQLGLSHDEITKVLGISGDSSLMVGPYNCVKTTICKEVKVDPKLGFSVIWDEDYESNVESYLCKGW